MICNHILKEISSILGWCQEIWWGLKMIEWGNDVTIHNLLVEMFLLDCLPSKWKYVSFFISLDVKENVNTWNYLCISTYCRCEPPYYGNPEVPGDYCRVGGQCNCDSRGSYSSQCDADGNCRCKVSKVDPAWILGECTVLVEVSLLGLKFTDFISICLPILW